MLATGRMGKANDAKQEQKASSKQARDQELYERYKVSFEHRQCNHAVRVCRRVEMLISRRRNMTLLCGGGPLTPFLMSDVLLKCIKRSQSRYLCSRYSEALKYAGSIPAAASGTPAAAVILSNRSLANLRLGKHADALKDAEKVKFNKPFSKGVLISSLIVLVVLPVKCMLCVGVYCNTIFCT